MAAHGGVPLPRLDLLAGGPLLEIEVALPVEDLEVDDGVEHPRPRVAGAPGRRPDDPALLVDQGEDLLAGSRAGRGPREPGLPPRGEVFAQGHEAEEDVEEAPRDEAPGGRGEGQGCVGGEEDVEAKDAEHEAEAPPHRRQARVRELEAAELALQVGLEVARREDEEEGEGPGQDCLDHRGLQLEEEVVAKEDGESSGEGEEEGVGRHEGIGAPVADKDEEEFPRADREADREADLLAEEGVGGDEDEKGDKARNEGLEEAGEVHRRTR